MNISGPINKVSPITDVVSVDHHIMKLDGLHHIQHQLILNLMGECVRKNWTNVDGVKNGSITCYHSDDLLHFTETWVDGLKHGYFEYNWSDGKCFHKGYYIYDKRHGWWEDYWSDGSVRHKGYYDMGVETYQHTDIRDKLIDITLEK